MKLDEAQSLLGGWRRWQMLMYCLISTAAMFIASWHMLANVYIGYVPPHHCDVNVADVPPHKSGKEGRLDSCLIYKGQGHGNDTLPCESGWVFKEKVDGKLVPYRGSTIVTQWTLVCDKAYLKDLSQTILATGVMIGAMTFSTFSDYFGRKPVFFFSLCGISVIGTINAFIPNFYAYLVLRFITGAFQQGIILTGFILACELFPAKYRTMAGIMIENFWVIATCLYPLMAYLIRDWSYLQLFISLAGFLCVPMYWIIPESISWLCAHDRIQEAEEILRKAARFNNIELPAHLLTTAPDSRKGSGDYNHPEMDGSKGRMGRRESGFVRQVRRMSQWAKEGAEFGAMYTLKDLFKHPKLRIYVAVMAFLWAVNTMVYFGLSLSTATLAGDRFLNSFLSAFVEGPAFTVSYFIIIRYGRRYTLMGFHVLAGIALVIANLLPNKTAGGSSLVGLNIAVQMIGKFGISGAFGVVFLYAPEIFPTTLRNQALGIASMIGRLGYMVTTFTPYVIDRVPWLPAPLFGTLSFLAAASVIVLPETHNKPLPQTIEDIENWFKKPEKENKDDSKEDPEL